MHRMTARPPARHLTIRDIPTDLARALDAERRRRGASLTQTVKDLLRQGLGLDPGKPFSNGLGSMAGGWTEEDLREFDEATKPFEDIDEDAWR